MPLSPEIREVVRQAALDAFMEPPRRLTPEELWVEVVRLCREAEAPEEIEAAGLLVGRITSLGKMIREAAAGPEKSEPEKPGPEPAAPAEGVPVPLTEFTPDQVDAVAEEAA